MKKKHSLHGQYKHAKEVNGVTIYTGGELGLKRVPGTSIQVKVCCMTCQHCHRYTAKNMLLYACMSVVTDKGQALDIINRQSMRCSQWTMMPRFYRIGKSAGKIDHPDFIRWKTEHPQYINDPEAHGCRPTELPHDFLYRKWQASKKKNPL